MPEFKQIALSELEIDRQNPRLPSSLKGADEDDIIKYLIRRTNIAELVTSIGENDFFPGEAIVVTPSKGTPGKYTVLEGNRRLTALKLIQTPALAGGISPGVAEVAANAKNRPTKVPAYEVNRREDVLQYLGFRHVSGVQRWDPLAKARYLKMLYEHADGQPESRYAQIASEIGSRRDTVQKNLDALAAYEVTEAEGFFKIPDLTEERFQFGVFYTALANSKLASFAGAKDDDGEPTHPIDDPQRLKVGEIRELVEWMFQKDGNGDTKLGESRNIPMLAAVVSSPTALQLLREGASLEDAYNETPDIQNEFILEIKTATNHVRVANTKVDAIDRTDPQVLQSVSEIQGEMRITMERLGL